jgi:hypothetical protein
MINTADSDHPYCSVWKEFSFESELEELFCFNFPYSGYMVIFSLTFEHE